MKALRVLESHREELDHCTYCPKLCRFTCPVSEATGREALTPWGKMTTVAMTAQLFRPPDEALATAAYACSGCGRCQSFCRDHVDVADTLAAARGVALGANVAPKGAIALLRRFREDLSPVGRLDRLVSSSDFQTVETAAAEQFFPGCVALAREPFDVRAAQAVGAALSMPLALARASDSCCGYPLYAAGDWEGFAAHARKVSARLPTSGTLVVGDPGCAHTFQTLYPSFGVDRRCEIKPLAAHLAAGLPQLDDRPPLPERVTYHDPCHLARSLNCTEAPREIINRAVGSIAEADHSRAEAVCSGAGAAMPWTLPTESAAMAVHRGAELVAAAPVVVTACPTAKRALGRTGLKVRDLAVVMASWMGVTPMGD